MPNLSNFVVSLALLALCLPGRAAAPSQHPFQLPPDAKIHIGKPYSVNLEEEMTKSANNQMDYAAVTSLYSKSLHLLKTAIGKG